MLTQMYDSIESKRFYFICAEIVRKQQMYAAAFGSFVLRTFGRHDLSPINIFQKLSLAMNHDQNTNVEMQSQ